MLSFKSKQRSTNTGSVLLLHSLAPEHVPDLQLYFHAEEIADTRSVYSGDKEDWHMHP